MLMQLAEKEMFQFLIGSLEAPEGAYRSSGGKGISIPHR